MFFSYFHLRVVFRVIRFFLVVLAYNQNQLQLRKLSLYDISHISKEQYQHECPLINCFHLFDAVLSIHGQHINLSDELRF